MLKRLRIMYVVIAISISTFLLLVGFSTLYESYTLKKKLAIELNEKRSELIEHEKEKLKVEIGTLIESIALEEKLAYDNLKNSLVEKVTNLEFMIRSLDKNLDEDEVNKVLLDLLDTTLFLNGRGYYFIWTPEGEIVYNPTLREFEGRSYRILPDKTRVETIEELTKLLTDKGEGFVEYSWNKIGKEQDEPKLAYVKSFPERNWYIGAGEYLTDYQDELEAKLIEGITAFEYEKDEDDYIYITDYDGRMVGHPVSRELIGKFVGDIRDEDGVAIFDEQMKIAKMEGEGFYTYKWIRPKTRRASTKLTYVKSYDPYEWILGSGIYLESIEEQVDELRAEKEQEIRKSLKNFASVVILILLIFLAVLMLVNLNLTHDLKSFSAFFVDAVEHNKKIDLKRIKFKDFLILAKEANKMIEDKVKVEDKLTYMATKDSLTGLVNRRAFFEKLNTEFAKAKRYDLDLTVFMIDLDHFKKINDTYGHGIGDIVLQEFAKRCKKLIRDVDILGRIGGEEFAIIAPNTELESGIVVAKRIVEYFGNNTIDTHEGLKVTVSIGIESFRMEYMTASELLNNADKKLYRAKENGRNRVVY